MAIPTTKDPNGRPIILGSYVKDTGHGRIGRVTGIDTGFAWTAQARSSSDGGAAWLAGQAIPVTRDQRAANWISILVHGGGSVLVPADRVEVVDPFPLDNYYAALYFSDPDPADLAIARSDELTQVTALGGELRIWEPGVHGDDNERDLGRMYVLEALGVSLLVRERPDGTYVHIEDEGVVRKPLLVEVDNGGEHPYGDAPVRATCKHCSRFIEQVDGRWIDPEASGDDSIWRETCEGHDTFEADHEPESGGNE